MVPRNLINFSNILRNTNRYKYGISNARELCMSNLARHREQHLLGNESNEGKIVARPKICLTVKKNGCYDNWRAFCSSPSAEGKTRRPLIQLFTKNDCSLCEIAKETLEKFSKECDIEEVDIEKEENCSWFDKYKYEIPVVHLNGKFLMKNKVFKGALEDALKNLNQRNKLSSKENNLK